MNTYNKITTIIISVFIFSIACAQTSVDVNIEQEKAITLVDIWAKGTFYPKSIPGLTSTSDGIHYTMLKDGGIDICSYKTGKKIKTLVSKDDLILKGTETSVEIESYKFSNDETKILIATNEIPIYRHSSKSQNYVYDIKTKELIMVADGKYQQLASFSADGYHLAYVRDNNIYTFDLNSRVEKQITTDGEFNNIINGSPDWVYEEEFSFARGFHWSPDGNKIAFYKFDESAVKQFTLFKYGDLYPEEYKYKYPKAGEDNSIVTINVYDMKTGKTVEMDIGSEKDQYIPRIKWTKNPDVLSVTRLNRLQNKLELLLADAKTGDSKVILTETNKYYVDITDDLTFLEDNEHFIWTSEKDGYNHIYIYNMDGKEINQITKGKWDVTSFKGVNEKLKTVYYISSESSPIERDLYSVRLDGSNKTKLSTKKGTNNAHFSKTFKYYINYYSNANTPNFITVHNAKGKQIGEPLQDNIDLINALEEHNAGTKEFFKFKTTEGIELNGWMIKPPGFNPGKKYPVFMTVYGGPGSNTVSDSWSYTGLWHHLIAQKGYIVVSVDNRGTGNRGEEFKKSTYLQLGKLETIDQAEAAKWLGTLSYVDKDRIGIQGWSYGGYMSSLCLFRHPDLFKMAIAVAPVTNWRYYDNIYTERFMRTPRENADGYDDNSPITYAENLKGKYLLIHGDNDDNVHIQNSMDLIKALNDANKQFDLHIYPNKNHGIYGGLTRLHLFTKMTNYILLNL